VDQFRYIIAYVRSVACVLNGLLYVRGNSKWADDNVPLYFKKVEDNLRGGDFTDQTLPSGHSRATQYHKKNPTTTAAELNRLLDSMNDCQPKSYLPLFLQS
jgi:hypothetical protein